MKFLSVGPDAKHVDHFNHFVKSSESTCFVIFHSPNCHFCVETIPEWHKISSELGERFKHNDAIMVADIDASALSKTSFEEYVEGLPTILCVSEKGKKIEPIENAKLKNKLRTVDAFVEWIELKSPSIYHSNKTTEKGRNLKRRKATPYPGEQVRKKSISKSRSKSKHGGKRTRKLFPRK
jgi:hypothetical protein